MDFKRDRTDMKPLAIGGQTVEKVQKCRYLGTVTAEAEKTGFQINIGKTEAMRVNNKQDDPLRLHQEKSRRLTSLSTWAV